MLLAFVILLFGAMSRVLPHWMGTTSANVTMATAALLFFGSRMPPHRRWLSLLAVAVMAITDVYLTTVVYGYPFHVKGYWMTWTWYAAVCFIGYGALHARRTPARVVLTALGTSTGFFLWSNFMVWAGGHMYSHTGSGLAACYVAALPFYRNEAVSTLVFSCVFFALPWAAAVLRQALGEREDHGAAA